MNGRWTTLDLEAFHDGEMPADDAAQLAADLRSDGDLRASLAEVAQADRAAAAVLAISAAVWFGGGPRATPSMAPTIAAAGPGPRAGFRCVFAEPLAINVPAARRVAAAKERPTVIEPPVRPASRPSAGGPPRSATELDERLRHMNEQEQLAACIAWAPLGRQTPAIFERIAALGQTPTMRGEVAEQLDRMIVQSPLRAYALRAKARIEERPIVRPPLRSLGPDQLVPTLANSPGW